MQQDLKSEEERREIKNAATDILPFIIVRTLLNKIRLQIQKENKIRAHLVLQSALKSNEFKMHLKKITQNTSCRDIEKDMTFIYENIFKFFSDPNENENNEIFKMSEDETAGVLSLISTIENYDCSKLTDCKSDIYRSIQRSQKIREKLKKSSIENLEEHSKTIASLSSQIDKVRFIKEQKQIKLNELEDKIQTLRSTLEKTKKRLAEDLKKIP